MLGSFSEPCSNPSKGLWNPTMLHLLLRRESCRGRSLSMLSIRITCEYDKWGKLELEPTELWFWQQCHFVRGRTSVARTHIRILLRVRGGYALDLKTRLQDQSVWGVSDTSVLETASCFQGLGLSPAKASATNPRPGRACRKNESVLQPFDIEVRSKSWKGSNV